MFAQVVVDILARELDRPFTYRIPEGMRDAVQTGSIVTVPFGKGNKPVRAYCINITDDAGYDIAKIKNITEVITDATDGFSNLVALSCFISRRYGSTFAAALRTVFPVKQKVTHKTEKFIYLTADGEQISERLAFYEKKHQAARLRLLKELAAEKVLPFSLVTDKLNVSHSAVKALIEQGMCEVDEVRSYRGMSSYSTVDGCGIVLNDDQQRAVDGIWASFLNNDRRPVLIKGITGSGKTEVYIELIGRMVRSGYQAVMLVPEIALTYQTLKRFYQRFGDRVAAVNSRMSQGERYDQFERIREGLVDVVIGPRSALFAPFSNLGIIVIDEEHETSYKSGRVPKYHARETAGRLAELSGAMLVLGSATPSVESYYKAQTGEYSLYSLNSRAKNAMLPQTAIVDMKKELFSGNRSVFSSPLKAAIEDRLCKKQQVILFLNRRGMAGFVSCRKCGHVFKCRHCDVSLTYHRNGKLSCHYCGYEEVYSKICPECGSSFVSTLKFGTEAVENEVKTLFPDARVLRMDLDTTKNKNSHEEILSSFANDGADILIGTQMIVKGHDFPNVTLVGVLMADMSLYVSDYRARERTFDLLTQAAGRAGRGRYPGEVYIQTYNPEDETIGFAARQDYEGFYGYEILYRELLKYPPVSHILALLMEDSSEEYVRKIAVQMETNAKRLMLPVVKIGPAAASIGYIKDIYRYMLYFKSDDLDSLIKIKDVLEAEEMRLREMGHLKNSRLQFDLDPVEGY